MNEKLRSKTKVGIWTIKIWYLLATLNLSSSIDILIVESENSRIWIEEATKQFDSVIEFHHCNYSIISECLNMNPDASIILDLSDDIEAQITISQFCQKKKIHLIAQSKYEIPYFDEWTYNIIPSKLSHLNAYFSVLNYFNWVKGLVITDEDNIYIKEKILEYYDNFDYLTIESSANIENLVSRVIKPLGATLYYIFADPVLSLKIQEVLKSKKLLLKGDGIILNQNSGYGCTIDGAVIITEAGQEDISSQMELLSKSTQNLLQYLVNNTIEPASIEQLKNLLKKYSGKNQFSIVNIKDRKREIFGSISDSKVNIFKNLTFPGNNSEVPKPSKKILYVTVSGGSYNPGTPLLTATPSIYYGAYTAWSLINDGTLGILNNFQINHFIFDCGVTNFDQKYSTACFTKDIDKFGLAHIPAVYSPVVVAEMKFFKSLNLTFPIIGATPIDGSLSSTALYPMFTRVIISSRYTLTLASLLFKTLGWNKACVLYYNDTTQISQYSTFMESAAKYGLEIINPEGLRMITASSNRTDIKKNANELQAIVDTEARLLVLIVGFPEIFYHILEELYDMGLRKGDLFTFVIWSGYLTLTQYDFMYINKIKETGIPMISISGENWVGKTGQFVYSKIESLYKTVHLTYACYSYDAAYLIASAFDYMINHGLDYYDPFQANASIRAQKFTGCTGKVSIDKNSNDRVMDTFDISVNKINVTSGNVTAYKMGEFNPYRSAMLTIEAPIIYGDGTTIKPDDLRNQDYECPFAQKSVRTFTKGRFLSFGICFAFALVSFALTAYIWKRYWNIPIEELTKSYEISLEDFVVELTIGIEFFQFLAMGPDITPISSTLAKISNSFSLNLEDILKLKNGVFWVVIDGVYGFIILWLILCLVILLRLDEKFPRSSIFRFLAWLADYLMPALGNLCFIPFISMCLNVFICDQSIGENFTDSFLSQDCYVFCWKGDHLIYAIFSFVALISYEPLAVFCRPLWQELQHKIHIQAAPLFLMVKTVTQIIFVVMNKTIKRAESTIHGISFAILMLAYIVFVFKYKPYNYPRLSWWQGLSLIGVLWISVLSTISLNFKMYYFIYFLLVCVGWILIISVGIYVQKKKYPRLLYRKKGADTTNLYRFAFTFGKNSKIALSKIVPSRSSGDNIKNILH